MSKCHVVQIYILIRLCTRRRWYCFSVSLLLSAQLGVDTGVLPTEPSLVPSSSLSFWCAEFCSICTVHHMLLFLILLEITTHLLHFYLSGRLSHKDLILSEVNEGGPMRRWTPDPRYTSFINKVIFSSTLVVAGMQNGRSYMEFCCLLFSQISKNGFNLSCVSIHHPSSSSFPC